MIASCSKLTNPTVGFLLRDEMQSALRKGRLNFNPVHQALLVMLAAKAGFSTAEVAGGNNFQSAIGQGVNPFNVMEYLDLSTKDADGNRMIDLQMLFRGANALGFQHYSPDVIEVLLNEFVKNGITKIRFFDALNDIDNIYIPNSLQNKGLNLQGALCFGRYDAAPDRYTDDYYLNYAQALVNKGCTSLAIKDMSGRLDADRATALVTKLKQKFPDKKLELHIHSTDESKSLAAIKAAIVAGIDGIETAEGPLKKGTSHHDLASIDDKYRTEAYEALVNASDKIFANSERADNVAADIKEKLCALGVPGGAMPTVLGDLKKEATIIAENNKEFFSEGYTGAGSLLEDQEWLFKKSLELFLKEFPRVCRDAAYPLIVTPTANIVTKQAIFNPLGFNSPRLAA